MKCVVVFLIVVAAVIVSVDYFYKKTRLYGENEGDKPCRF